MNFLIVVTILAYIGVSRSEGETEGSSFWDTRNTLKFGNFDLPPGYRLEIPHLRNPEKNATEYIPLLAQVSLSIRSVLVIDQNNAEIKLDTDLGIKWHDDILIDYARRNDALPKRSNSTGSNSLKTINSGVLKLIWKPDVFIEQLSSVKRSSVVSIPTQFRVNSDGDFIYSSRMEMVLRCDMDFTFFPADTQYCLFQLRSYSYTMEELRLIWQTGNWPYLENPYHPNFDVMVYNVEPYKKYKGVFLVETYNNDTAGNYTALHFSMKLRRRISYHLVQTYLPSLLLILITWVCFLLPSEMVEVRVGISMTTVLTLTALFATVREQSPQVSYTMAVDVWMVFNIFLVFVTLLAFSTLYWMQRSVKKKKQMVADDYTEDDHDTYIQALDSYRRIVHCMKNYAFWTFAMTFGLFVTVYWICLIIGSRYLNFSPEKEFNGIPYNDEHGEEDGGRYGVLFEHS